MNGERPVLETHNLSKVFGRRVAAVDNVSIELSSGVHGLVGPNGAGKSTLIQMLGLLLKPSSGRLELFGASTDQELKRRAVGRIGYLPQAPRPPHALTTAELVEYTLRLRGHTTDITAVVDESIEQVHAGEFRNEGVRSLSGGQRQRAFIAAAIAGAPDLILLDEPTSGLDPEQRTMFRAVLAELGRKACVVLSTHLIEDVWLGCDTVSVMTEGFLRFHGSVTDLLNRSGSENVDQLERTSLLEHAYLEVVRS